MELYYRYVDIFDKKIVDDFAKEHKEKGEIYMAGDCSLIIKKGYQQINDFYKWYKEVRKLDTEENLSPKEVGCSCFLVFRKSDDRLIALFDLRHSLDFPNGKVYGHIGVDIRPSERGKGYYKDILELALKEAKNYNINPVVISCEYDNNISYKGIEHVFGEPKGLIPLGATYLYVFEKNIKTKINNK